MGYFLVLLATNNYLTIFATLRGFTFVTDKFITQKPFFPWSEWDRCSVMPLLQYYLCWCACANVKSKQLTIDLLSFFFHYVRPLMCHSAWPLTVLKFHHLKCRHPISPNTHTLTRLCVCLPHPANQAWSYLSALVRLISSLPPDANLLCLSLSVPGPLA